jgi:hypothetical protein
MSRTMQFTRKLWVLVVLLAGLLLAACGPLAEAAPGQSVLPVERTDVAVTERQALDAASAAGAGGTEIEFTGSVTSIGANEWVIGGQAVQVTAQTEIKAGVALGSVVKVHALPQTDGSLVAREIEPEAAAVGTGTTQPGTPPAGSEQEFTGTLTATNGDVWTIGGRAVRITSGTEIKGSLNIGDVLKVHAAAGADGVLVAREVELAADDDLDDDNNDDDNGNPAGEQEFTGALTAINGDVWTIAGRQVRITTRTEVKGNLLIGNMLKVHASPGADGVLVAREVELAADDDLDDDSGGDDNSGPGGGDDDGADDNSGHGGDDDEDDDSGDDNSGHGGGDDDGGDSGDDNSGHGGGDDDGGDD